jgi:hypothetical protein
MSTAGSINEMQQLRSEVLKTNNNMRTLSHLAATGTITLRDLLTLTRLLTGGNPQLSTVIVNMQTAIAIAQTARTSMRLLQLEMMSNPWGWVLMGVGTFIGLTAMSGWSETPGI